IVKKNQKFTQLVIRKLQKLKLKTIPVDEEELYGSVLAEDIIDNETGEVIADANTDTDQAVLERLREAGIKEFKILFIDNLNVGPYLRNTLNLELAERRRGRTGAEEGALDTPEEA